MLFEPKWSLSDFDDEEMKKVYDALKNNKDVNLDCRKEIRIGSLRVSIRTGELKVSMPMREPFPEEEKHLHLELCEIWDDESDIAQLIKERHGTINSEDNDELMNLREQLPFITHGDTSPGYCISSEVPMPKTPQELQTIIENNEERMLIGSREKLDEIIVAYGGNKIGGPNWVWDKEKK